MLQLIAPERRKRYLLTAIFWFIAILLAALQAWNKRFILSSEDTISYLDIGDTYLRGDWKAAVNGYWSPLYPWLLALTSSILRPSTYWEFPLVKLVNLLTYLFTLFSFDLLLQAIIFSTRQKILLDKSDNNRYLIIPEWIWIVLGYTLFIWSSLEWTTINSDTPDMCVMAVVYLASAIVLRSHAKSASWFDFILLGVVLGFGYLAKAAMFPMALLFLVIAAFTGGNIKKTLLGASVSFLVFALIVTPYISTLSIQKGRFTFGDNGKLNYVWNVNPGSYIIPDNHWQGGSPGNGTPKHPTRQIFEDPPVFEFATPLGGTYPIWYDPSYWYEGLTIEFNLANQIKVFTKNISYYRQLFLNILIVFYLILICTSGMFLLSLKALIGNWRLLVPGVVGLFIYAIATDIPSSMILSQPSPRYIAPFIVLLFAGVFSSVRFPNSQTWKRLIAAITIVVFTIFGCQLFFQASKNLATLNKPLNHVEWQVAETVRNLGIQPSEKVATFVDDYYGITPHVFWARLARVKIVAEITNAKSFWAKSATIRSEVIKTIEKKTGAKIIVHRPKSQAPDDILTDGWQKIGNTRYYIYLFQTDAIKN